MGNEIILICGRSGSGKTTICNILSENYGLKQLQSYTTRPRRSEDEIGHTFVTNEDFDKLDNIVAFTVFNGYRYCATAEQLDNSDLYVIDPSGIEFLKSAYQGTKKIVTVFIDTPIGTAYERMVDRSVENGLDYMEAVKSANERMVNDVVAFKDVPVEDFDYCFVNDTDTSLKRLAETIMVILSSGSEDCE